MALLDAEQVVVDGRLVLSLLVASPAPLVPPAMEGLDVELRPAGTEPLPGEPGAPEPPARHHVTLLGAPVTPAAPFDDSIATPSNASCCPSARWTSHACAMNNAASVM